MQIKLVKIPNQFFCGGGEGRGDKGVKWLWDMNTRAAIFYYFRHVVMTSSTKPFSLMIIFKIEGIVALTIKER